MFAQLPMWVVAMALVQAQPEPAWLKAVPGDMDVIIRTRGLDATREHLTVMLTAMSPTLGESAGPALSAQINRLRGTFGPTLTEAPCVALVKVAQTGPDGSIPFAVLVLKDDYAGVLKSVAGGNAVTPKPRDGGYDSFEAGGNGTWYAVKGAGFVAFGPDESVIAAVAKPKDPTFAKVLTPTLAEPFLAGDLGAYVNAGALSTRYADVIAQAREGLMAAMDQAGQQAGNAATMASAKAMYGALFDSLKYADALTLGLDPSRDEAHLSGALSVKPGSDAAKAIAESRAGMADDLGKLPLDSAIYMYMNLDAKLAEQMQNLSMRMIDSMAPGSPELARAKEAFHGLGSIETIGGVTMFQGMRGLNVSKVRDPKAYVAASRAMMLALKPGPGAAGFYKDIKIEQGAQKHRGFSFDHMVATLDFDKVAGPNPAGAASLRATFGGDSMNTWLGTDGQRVIQVMAPSWDDARARIDAFLDGKASIGATAGYKAVRSRLPEQSTVLMLASAQGLVRMIAAQMEAAAGKEAKPAAAPDPAGEPALFGGSLTPRLPSSYEFHLVVPTGVGPVFEKGLAPVFRDLPRKVDQ